MNPMHFKKISNKYKHCPNCNESKKSDAMIISLEKEVVTISCKCGWTKDCIVTTNGTVVDLN